MRRLRNLTALFLVVLWLPATQHCDLEAAGVWAGSGCCAADNGCAQDECGTVESGDFKSGSGTMKLPSAPRTILHFAVSLLAANVPAGGETGFRTLPAHGAADDWLPQWRFARRAAPLPGAPARG